MNFLSNEWNTASKLPGGGAKEGGGSGTDSMMDARRRALQLQREEREARQRRDNPGHSSSTNTGLVSRSFNGQNEKLESSPPLDIFGESEFPPSSRGDAGSVISGGVPPSSSGNQNNASLRPSPSEKRLGKSGELQEAASVANIQNNGVRDSQQGVSADMQSQAAVAGLEESVSSLQQTVTAKKKMLKSLREKEFALLAKVRSEKAHKKAEIVQIETQIRTMWEKVENEKLRVETKMREMREKHEKSLHEMRRQAESSVREKYEPQIEELQLKLESLQNEENRLKEVLLQEGSTKNLLDTAVASATNAIIERLHNLFLVSNEEETANWSKEVEELVRHEVRSSFAVGVGSEAQNEKECLEKYFYDMLELWKQVEEEERSRILKMDDTLLSDIQNMAQENISRLQQEEVALDEVYIQSREVWASQHQKMLDLEQEAALRRRENDFNEHRLLLNQLHNEKIKFVEEQHEEAMKLEEKHHKKEMQILKEFSMREEELQHWQHQTLLLTQQEVQSATQSFETIINSVEDIAKGLKSYQEEVDRSRLALDDLQVKCFEDQERVLLSMKALLTNQQRVSESQHKHLSSTVVELSTLENMIQSHLRDEETWLTQQEAHFSASREEWQREYHKWKQIVEVERCRTEEQFSESLLALQRCFTAMESEERELRVEMDANKSAFGDVAREAEKEVGFLDTREKELQIRYEGLQATLHRLEQQSSETSAHYQKLLEQREELSRERTRIAKETSKMKYFENTVHLLQSALTQSQKGSLVSKEPSREGRKKETPRRTKTTAERSCISQQPCSKKNSFEKKSNLSSEKQSFKESRNSNSYRTRLPHQVLQELHHQLNTSSLSSRQAKLPIPRNELKNANDAHLTGRGATKEPSKHVDPLRFLSIKNEKNSSSNVRHASQRDSSFSSSTDDRQESNMTNTFTNLLTISDHSQSSR